MAATKYTYSIQTDFPNHKVATDRLLGEVSSSAVTIAIDHINTEGDDCDVWFKGVLSSEDEAILDALVAAHSGEPLPGPLVDPQGAPYVSLLLGQPGLKLCIKGAKFDAPANQTTDNDVSFAQVREIQGSWCEVAGHQPGDYVEMKLCLPDGTVLGQFGETVYIPPSGKIDPIVAEGTVSFPAGLLIRMSYTAVDAGTVRTVYAWHRLRK
jgi:hypothetical protein